MATGLRGIDGVYNATVSACGLQLLQKEGAVD
jgi:hypothetical protein